MPKIWRLHASRILSLTLLALLLVATHSAALNVYVNADVGVSQTQYATAYSSQRKIVRNAAGELFVVYLKRISNHTQVYLAKSSDEGNTWIDGAQVSHGDFESVRAALAIDSRGIIYVTWTKFVGGYGQIYYRTYSAGTLSDEVTVTSGDAYSGFPSIAVDSKDLVHVVWYGFDGFAYQIYYSSYDGVVWSLPQQLSQGFPDSVNPSIAVDLFDRLHVVWYKNNGRQYQIYYVNRTRDWSDQTVISSGSTDSYNPSIAIDGRNAIHVVWDKQVDGFTQIFYSKSENGWTSQLQLTTGQTRAENPSITIDASGNLYVFFERGDREIYLKKYQGRWLDDQKISNDGENSFPSSRWSFNHSPRNGTVDVIWTHQDQLAYRIRYKQFQTGSPPISEVQQSPTAYIFFASLAVLTGILAVWMAKKRNRVRAYSKFR